MLTLTIDKDFEMLKALLGTLFLKHFGGPAKVKVKPVTKDSFMFIWLPAYTKPNDNTSLFRGAFVEGRCEKKCFLEWSNPLTFVE